MAPEYLINLLVKLPNSNCNLRSNICHRRLLIPRVKNQTFASLSFNVKGPVLWNQLPNDIKASTSIKLFKKKLKTHIFKNYFT